GGSAVVASLLADLADAGAATVDAATYAEKLGCDAFDLEWSAALAACATERAAAVLLDQADPAVKATLTQPTDESARRALAWADFGLHLTTPWRVVFFGRANVGKSRLLNALAGYERAVVADRPGTTRDVVKATTALDGWSVELVDGAGFRDDAETLEADGRRLLEAELARADLRVQIVDGSQPWTAVDHTLADDYRPQFRIATKSDLPPAWNSVDPTLADHACSALNGAGIFELIDLLAARLVPRPPPPAEPVPFTAAQIERLRRRLAPPSL
ncbi:MAG: GTPase, partial [Planctomycetia bacterium]